MNSDQYLVYTETYHQDCMNDLLYYSIYKIFLEKRLGLRASLTK